MAKGSVFETIGSTMTNFARGVYNNIDTKATTKMITKHAKNNGGDRVLSEKIIKSSLNSNAAKLGSQITDTAPLKGIRDSARKYNNAANSGKPIKLKEAIKQGHQKIGADGKAQYDMGKIAGTTFSVGVAGRIVTGGGLYKDKYGNTNLPGIPFI